MNHSPKIKKYVLTLILFFLGLSLIETTFFLNTFTQLKINGPTYSKIKQYKDLKVDIYPPKLYIVEPYRLIQQTALPQYTSKISENIFLIEHAKNEYDKYYTLWKNKNLASDLYLLLMEESHGFVERFFNFYQEQFLPAIESNDYQTAQEILKNQLDPLFVLHKARIDESSLLIDAQTISTEVFSEAKTNLYSIILFITFFLSIGITVFISLIIFSKIKKNETLIINAKKETESLNTILEENIQKMTRFKHNYDNTLASITGYVYCNNLSGLRDFLAELQFEHKDVDFKKYGALSSLRHHGLIGLILSKMDYAKKQNISFDIQTFGSFSHLRMKPHHICEIIGILLDNAIEGVLETSMRKVCFHISSTSTENHFQISNTIQKLHDPSKIFKEGFSSKGEKRGNGLGIAHKIISSYPNATLNTFIKDNTFTQELVIH